MTLKGQGSETKLPDREQIDSLLRYIPVFGDPGYMPIVAVSDGTGREPYPIWAEEVREFYRELEYDGFLLEYDTPVLQKELKRYIDDPSLLSEIDLETICRLFTAHLQRETFCEGHFPEMVRSGHMCALLERLGEISVR
jgi:hypothetical protein